MPHTPVPRSVPHADQLLSVTTVRGPHRGRVIVEAVGEVDAYTAPLLEACLRSRATVGGVRDLVVDLHRVTFIGAAGVGVLARGRDLCRAHGVRLLIRTGGSPRVERPLELTGLTDVVAVETAGAEYSSPPSTRTRVPPRPNRRRASMRRPRRVCR